MTLTYKPVANDPHSAYWFSPEAMPSVILDHIAHRGDDEAYKGYASKLKEFILSCFLRLGVDGTTNEKGLHDSSHPEQFQVEFAGGKRMYHHSHLYVRFTAYNGSLGIDTLTKGTTFMVAETRDSAKSPYRFGQIVEIFHIWVMHPAKKNLEPMDLLWVRWYEVAGRSTGDLEGNGAETASCYSSQCANCPGSLRYLPATKSTAFGFLRPNEILRKVPVVGDVLAGTTMSFLGPSSARLANDIFDYNFYKVQCTVDHDLFMRLHTKPASYHLLREMETPILPLEDLDRIMPNVLPKQRPAQHTKAISHSLHQSVQGKLVGANQETIGSDTDSDSVKHITPPSSPEGL